MSDPPLDLEELKRLMLRAAQIGDDWPNGWFVQGAIGATMAQIRNAGGKPVADVIGRDEARFIVAAVNSLPALIAEVERLRAENAWLTKVAAYD